MKKRSLSKSNYKKMRHIFFLIESYMEEVLEKEFRIDKMSFLDAYFEFPEEMSFADHMREMIIATFASVSGKSDKIQFLDAQTLSCTKDLPEEIVRLLGFKICHEKKK